MALSVKYNVSPEASLVTLYRSVGSKIDLNNLPTNKVILDKNKSEYTYSDAVNNTYYSVVIETTDVNGYKNYSPIQDVLYKSELGPGPSKITRGYFDFGVYGEVTSEELGITPDGARDFVNSIAGDTPVLGGAEPSNIWVKCLVNKRIIFIPKNRMFYMGPTSSYSAATLYKTRLCDQQGLVDDCPTMVLKGREYKWRSLCHHNTDLTGAAALAAIKDIGIENGRKLRSEIGMYLCLTRSTVGMAGVDKDGLGLPAEPSNTQAAFRGGYFNHFDVDSVIKAYGLGTHVWPAAGSGCFVYMLPSPVLGVQGLSDNHPHLVAAIPVLELLD